jgi:hypothetical protein
MLANLPVLTWPRSTPCHPDRVSAEELHEAVAEYRAAEMHVAEAKASVTGAQLRLKNARKDLEAAVVEAYLSGTRMRDLTASTGLSREWVRTLLRRNNIFAED